MTTSTDLALDYTALSTAAECGRKFKHKYRDRLRERTPNVPMFAGQVAHVGLDVLYTHAWDIDLAIEAMRDEWGDFKPLGKHSYLTFGHLSIALRNYFEDRSENPTALEGAAYESAEDTFIFDWPNADGELVTVGGKPDLPCEIASQRYIVDHKLTTQWVNTYWALRWKLGHQFRIYCAAMSNLFERSYDGAYVNGIHMGKAAADEPTKWKKRKSSPNRLFGPYDYSRGKLEETWQWVNTWQRTIELWDELDHWPQDETSCANYGGCEFMTLCEKSPVVRNAHASREFERWEPLGKLLSGADGNKEAL